MQSATGFIVGRFTEVGEVAPEVACRSVFGFLALMIVVSLALYLPVRDIETGWHGRGWSAGPRRRGTLCTERLVGC